jgi:hypothetical protein
MGYNEPQFDIQMPLEWNLHYARWVIEDGEPELASQQDFDWFSLEFWAARRLTKSSESLKSAIAVFDYKYRIFAEVIFLSEKACVLDFGLRAIGDADVIPSKCKQGNYVTGEVSLGLPLCTEIAPQEVLDTLRHKWHVNGIDADLTPYISHPREPKYYFRDESRIRHEPVLSTASARTHDYVLHCSKLE